jgi:hypothetical protein
MCTVSRWSRTTSGGARKQRAGGKFVTEASRPKVVCFVDIDGVAHAQGDSRYDELTSKLVGEGLFRWWPQLREVLSEHPDIDVVVHSSWRQIYPSLDWLRPELPPDMAVRVVDVTDVDIYSRNESIEAYLRVHPEVAAYVVLDDSNYFPSHVPLVLCDPQRGMSDPVKADELRVALLSAKERATRGER